MLMVIVTWSTFMLGEFVDVVGQREAVGRDAELDVGDLAWRSPAKVAWVFFQS